MKKTTFFAISMAFAMFQNTSSASANDYLIKMVSKPDGSYAFEPDKLTIKSGDTVTWENNQDDTHDVMSESTPKGAKYFESPMLAKKGDKWSHKFTVSGTYAYHCHPHAEHGMLGTIIVDHASKDNEANEGGEHNHHEHNHK